VLEQLFLDAKIAIGNCYIRLEILVINIIIYLKS
jgi:hypothetical protein